MICYQKNYPRPQFVRKQWESLNGTWDFSFDDLHIGITNHWFLNFPDSMPIQVPFTYESKLSGIGIESQHSCLWYHRTFDVNFMKLKSHNYIIHFEGVDYEAHIWVNGHYIGSHIGAYARFSFDLTAFVHEGSNDIVMKVIDTPSIEQMRGKQRWKDENYGVFYTQTTGIYKTVWSEYVPKTHISYFKLTPHIETMQIEIEADIFRSFEHAHTPLLLEACVTFNNQSVNRLITEVHLADSHFNIDLRSLITDTEEFHLKLWSPENPQLYDLSLKLFDNQILLDEIGSYFAMREISINGTHILLNGVPLYQRLVLDQGYWTNSLLTPPNEEALIRDIELIKNLGYNGVRKHQKIEDERFFYWCDVKGLLVWCEAPSYFLFTGRSSEIFRTHWMEIVKQNYNHPCIITWTLFNESWGITHVKTSLKEQLFTQAIYYLTKSFDPYRPVITNDGWEHTISDIITIHDYNQDGTAITQYFSEYKEEILSSNITPFTQRATFADGFSYRGQPVIISEYGGLSIQPENPGFWYGNMISNDEFLPRYESITKAIKQIPYICGFCYTQFSDTQQEINGMVDMNRNYKVEPKKIQNINLS